MIKTPDTMRIHKYGIPIDEEFSLQLPEGADILDVQVQNDTPYIWAMVDTEKPGEQRHFRVIGTGNPIKPFEVHKYRRGYKHIGTFQMANGQLVWHLFEA